MIDSISEQGRTSPETILLELYGLRVHTVTPVKGGKNNSILRIDLRVPTSSLVRCKLNIPGVSPIPRGTTTICMRIPKPGRSLDDEIRVPNSVALANISREALAQSGVSTTVPLCFGWENTAGGGQWILEEWKEGIALGKEEFSRLERCQREDLMNGIAAVVKALQDYQLPESIRYHGGITYGPTGDLVPSRMPMPCGGPFHNYAGLIKAMCGWQLRASDRSETLQGWRAGALRSRLDAFLESGLDGLLATIVEAGVNIVHGDLSIVNVLVDSSKTKVLALLDFDLAHIGPPLAEYVLSFGMGLDYCLPGSADIHSRPGLRENILGGFGTLDPPCALDSSRAFHAALNDAGAEKPSDIKQADLLSDLWWFSQDICQAFWLMPAFLEQKSGAQLQKMKDSSAADLEHYLSMWNF